MEDEADVFIDPGADLILSLCGVLLLALALLSGSLLSQRAPNSALVAESELGQSMETCFADLDAARASDSAISKDMEACEKKLSKVTSELIDYRAQVQRSVANNVRKQKSRGALESELADALKEIEKLKRAPPSIVLADSEFKFKPGSFEISQEFRAKLLQKTNEIKSLAIAYDANIIEVIGHTDTMPVGSNARSNLDWSLAHFRRGGRVRPTAADNVGLGMLRAMSVAAVLEDELGTTDYVVIPLSAGQLVNADGSPDRRLSRRDDPDRRRMELRVRRLE